MVSPSLGDASAPGACHSSEEMGWCMGIKKKELTQFVAEKLSPQLFLGSYGPHTHTPTHTEAPHMYLLSSEPAKRGKRGNVINGATPGDWLDGKQNCGYHRANFSSSFERAGNRRKCS